MAVFLEGNAGGGELRAVFGLDGAGVGHEHGVAFGVREQGRADPTFGGSEDDDVHGCSALFLAEVR